jgi:hypothetical protein
MHRFTRITASRLLTAGLCAGLTVLSSAAQTSVRSVKVLGSKDTVEIEVEASERIVPQTQLLTGPDRLVVDFPNAVPSNDVRSQSVDRGQVKDVRVGLFQKKPPVTRIVLDLTAARSYQVFPSGRTVMIKIVGTTPASTDVIRPANFVPQQTGRPGLVTANYTSRAEPVQVEAAPEPKLQVTYRNGLLGIRANKASLSEVLYAIQQRTGADIAIPAGAEQDKVVAQFDPAPAPVVLSQLLNGSRFNFMILSAADDPNKLDKVILSTRAEGTFVAPPVQPQGADDAATDDEPAFIHNQPNMNPPPPVQTPERPAPDNAAQDNENPPDQ